MSVTGSQLPPVAGRGRPTAPLADFNANNILGMFAEPQRAVAVLLEPVEEIYRLVGWHSVDVPPLAGTGAYPAALARAVNRLESQFNISLWDKKTDRPRQHPASDAAFVDGVGQTVVAADLASPMRVWMAGLSGGGSLAAGSEALASALCYLVASYLFSPHRSADDLASELKAVQPDVILVVGGYEQINAHSRAQVLALGRQVTDAAVQLPVAHRPFFCFAGAGASANAALAYWQTRAGGADAALAANVLNPRSAHSDAALHRVLEQRHWQRSLASPAMRKIAGWMQHPFSLRSTQWAFAQAVRTWLRRKRLPTLHGLYTGADRWLHVWASDTPDHGNEDLRICCVRPDERPAFLEDWPPLRLVSGDWPSRWPRPSSYWWDPLGLVPAVAGVGQAAPEAAFQALAADILQEEGASFADA